MRFAWLPGSFQGFEKTTTFGQERNCPTPATIMEKPRRSLTAGPWKMRNLDFANFSGAFAVKLQEGRGFYDATFQPKRGKSSAAKLLVASEKLLVA